MHYFKPDCPKISTQNFETKHCTYTNKSKCVQECSWMEVIFAKKPIRLFPSMCMGFSHHLFYWYLRYILDIKLLRDHSQ